MRESQSPGATKQSGSIENALLGVAPHLAEALAHLDRDPVVDEEELSLLEELPLCLERLVLCAELVEADDARDEPDLELGEEVLVEALRVLDEEGDGLDARVEDWVGDRTVRASRGSVPLVWGTRPGAGPRTTR